MVQMNRKITLRNATFDDAERLLEWRNDAVTRQNSLQEGQVERDQHLLWLAARLRDSESNLLIAEDAGIPVGTIRQDWQAKRSVCELSFTVAPEKRRQGYGSALVRQALGNLHHVTVTAVVKSVNFGSRKILENLGFTLVECGDVVLRYECKPESAARF